MGAFTFPRFLALAFTLFTLHSLLADFVQATTVTTVIDDASSNITYSGGNWVARSPNQSCDNCAGRGIDQSQFNANTWHEISEEGQADFKFFGTGISVVCTVGNMLGNQSNYTFYLDNQVAGNYIYKGIGSNSWLYNTSVFTRTGLTHGVEHTMRIVDGTTSFMAFDYALVTDETSDPVPISSSPPVSPTAALPPSPTTTSAPGNTGVPAASPPLYPIILGAAAGGAALIGLCVLVWWLLRRRRKRLAVQGRGPSPTHSETQPRPFVQVRRGVRSDLDIAGGDDWGRPVPTPHSSYATPWAVSSASLIRNSVTTQNSAHNSFYAPGPGPVPGIPYLLPDGHNSWSSTNMIPLQTIPGGTVYSPVVPLFPPQMLVPPQHGPDSVSSSSHVTSTTKSRQHLYKKGPLPTTQLILHQDGGQQLEVGEAPAVVEELPPVYASYNSTPQSPSSHHGQ